MKKPYIFPLLLGSLVLTGCANGQIDAMQMRLNQQEQQIRLLNSQLSGVQPAQADTWAQVQSLRQEMSAVKGQIDDFNNATAAAGGLPGLAQRVNNHEAALQAIATQFGMELPVAAGPGAPGAAPGMPDATAAAPVPAAPVGRSIRMPTIWPRWPPIPTLKFRPTPVAASGPVVWGTAVTGSSVGARSWRNCPRISTGSIFRVLASRSFWPRI